MTNQVKFIPWINCFPSAMATRQVLKGQGFVRFRLARFTLSADCRSAQELPLKVPLDESILRIHGVSGFNHGAGLIPENARYLCE
jgi:hypothetical protein